MSNLPEHKASELSDFGILLKSVIPSFPVKPVDYSHRDDYYIFGVIEEGSCVISIDFKEYRCSKGHAIVIQPGQVHSCIESTELKAYMLIVDNAFIEDSIKHTIAQYSLNMSQILLEAQQQLELARLYSVLSIRIGEANHEISKRLVQHLSFAMIEIIVGALQVNQDIQSGNKRFIELALTFKTLLAQKLCISRSPSYYAGLMNISPMYLNEAVKNATSLSVSRNIQNEVVLKAKRQLIYSSKSIQEIALELGFEDCAYFTRLFTKATCVSPTEFRKRYLK